MLQDYARVAMYRYVPEIDIILVKKLGRIATSTLILAENALFLALNLSTAPVMYYKCITDVYNMPIKVD